MAGSEEEEEEEEGERRRRGVGGVGRRRKRGGGGITGCAGQPGLLCPGEGGRGDGGKGLVMGRSPRGAQGMPPPAQSGGCCLLASAAECHVLLTP